MNDRDLHIMAGSLISGAALAVLLLWLGGAFDGWRRREPDWRLRKP